MYAYKNTTVNSSLEGMTVSPELGKYLTDKQDSISQFDVDRFDVDLSCCDY